MALRFRKSIKLAPGIRMNLSKSGMSWTLGPRGASIGIGKKGANFNTSLLGFSASHPLSRPNKPTKTTQRMQLTCIINNNGELLFKDDDGNDVNKELINKVKTQNREAITDLIQSSCDRINNDLEALAQIHLYTPPPQEAPKFIPEPFEEKLPKKPTLTQARWWEKPLKKRLQKINEKNQIALSLYQRDISDWEELKNQHEQKQAKRKELIEHSIYHNTDGMAQWFEFNLQDIIWPRETLISLDIVDDGKHILMDVDLPEIEDMPSKSATVPARGLRLSIKELPATRVRKLYMAHIHGIAFRLIGEAFALLPVVQRVTISGFSQRNNTATGQLQDDYLYSVQVTREDWERIDFHYLPSIDVVEALEQFDLRRNMSKTGVFKPITPFI